MSDPWCTISKHRKGGSMSFLENENQMIIDATMQEIAEQLLDNWLDSNLNEGQLYSDWQIAEMSSDIYLKQRFNLFYELTPDDQYYIEVE